MLEQNNESKGRLLAKLVWGLLHEEEFETIADLTEALKCRCARLRIRWTPDDITDAYTLVGSNTALVPDQKPRRSREPEPEGELISRETAAAILKRLGCRV